MREPRKSRIFSAQARLREALDGWPPAEIERFIQRHEPDHWLKTCTFLWRFIEGRRKPRAVKRSETECGLRAAAQISIAFANRAGLAGATIQNLRFDRQDWTCAPPDWP
jgi:hypothetical protein